MTYWTTFRAINKVKDIIAKSYNMRGTIVNYDVSNKTIEESCHP